MIESIHISGFRLFRDITLPKLGRMNLFVGENNTGKSCMLEAIGLYAGRTPVNDVIQTAANRSSERLASWASDGLNEDNAPVMHPIFELFHRAGDELGRRIIIEKVRDANPLRVELQLYSSVRTEDGFRQYVPATSGAMTPEPVEFGIPVYRGDTQLGLITRRMLPWRGRILDAGMLSNTDAATVSYLPAKGFSNEKAASLWDGLVQGPGQELVIKWLRMLDPRVEALTFIKGRYDDRLAVLKVEGQARVPLRSIGDGLTKLFHIALAVASAARGVVLIDEFENGLHWNVQERLWSTLANAAREFDVQIFATTHSRDCLKGFAAAGDTLGPERVSIYRLEHKENGIVAIDLPFVNVAAAIRAGEEIR